MNNELNWNEIIVHGIMFAVFYLAGMFSGYDKARKKYRGF